MQNVSKPTDVKKILKKLLQKIQLKPDISQSPLLLCHADGLLDKLLPTNWSGRLYASESVHNEMIEKKYKMPPDGSYSRVNLLSNDATNITLANGCNIRLTMVPLDAKNENFMFIIQDQYVTSILTDNFTSSAFDVFIRNKLLRNVIAEEIDVLYINDAVYKQPHSVRSYPSELILRSLVSLLQPRFVKGIWETPLPQYILHGCHIEELYA